MIQSVAKTAGPTAMLVRLIVRAPLSLAEGHVLLPLLAAAAAAAAVVAAAVFAP
jgi:hypothetical protein